MGSPFARVIFIADAGANYSSLLPPAILQHQQLLMPSLQVVDDILATLGTRCSTALQRGFFLFVSVAFFLCD